MGTTAARAESKSYIKACGVLCVMICGISMMLELYAISWALQMQWGFIECTANQRQDTFGWTTCAARDQRQDSRIVAHVHWDIITVFRLKTLELLVIRITEFVSDVIRTCLVAVSEFGLFRLYDIRMTTRGDSCLL